MHMINEKLNSGVYCGLTFWPLTLHRNSPFEWIIEIPDPAEFEPALLYALERSRGAQKSIQQNRLRWLHYAAAAFGSAMILLCFSRSAFAAATDAGVIANHFLASAGRTSSR